MQTQLSRRFNARLLFVCGNVRDCAGACVFMCAAMGRSSRIKMSSPWCLQRGGSKSWLDVCVSVCERVSVFFQGGGAGGEGWSGSEGEGRAGRHLTPLNQFTGVRGIWVFIRRGETSPLLSAFTCSMNKLLLYWAGTSSSSAEEILYSLELLHTRCVLFITHVNKLSSAPTSPQDDLSHLDVLS